MNYWIPVRAAPDLVVKYSQNERKLCSLRRIDPLNSNSLLVEGAVKLWSVLLRALGAPYAHLTRLPETLDLSKVESVDWE